MKKLLITALTLTALPLSSFAGSLFEEMDFSGAKYSVSAGNIERKANIGYRVDSQYQDSRRGVEIETELKGSIINLGFEAKGKNANLILNSYFSNRAKGEHDETTYSSSLLRDVLGLGEIAYESNGVSKGYFVGMSAMVESKPGNMPFALSAGAKYDGMRIYTRDTDSQLPPSLFGKGSPEGDTVFGLETETDLHRFAVTGGIAFTPLTAGKWSIDTGLQVSPAVLTYGEEKYSDSEVASNLGYAGNLDVSLIYAPSSKSEVALGYNASETRSYKESRDKISDEVVSLTISYNF